MKIKIYTYNTIEYIEMASIIRATVDSEMTKVDLSTGASIRSTMTLAQIESALDSQTFFRIHKSYIVNKNYVRRIHKSGEVETLDGIQLPIARRRFSEFVDFL